MTRIILHCDLDCFFAAVEIRDNPEYRGKPVIIGADPRKGKGRGVVSTCSYEAREFGLHSGMPISQAFKLCPHGIYLRPNFNKYKATSDFIHTILKGYTPNHYQKIGLDEAYLDITDICINFQEARNLADEIREEIYKKVGITISIGCAHTKSLAKIASDHNKPNGTTIVTPQNMLEFLNPMDITKIPGIGKKSKKYFNNKGIKTIGDIIRTP
ncbi:MAG: DNA polymerase IV, partial [Promethearchaeota archaeon]